MSMEPEHIAHELEQALDALAKERDADLARQLKPILLANLDRGRIHSFTEGRTARVRAYVWRVATGFADLHAYLHQLQTERDPEAWTPLFARMQTWAYNFFLRKNFTADDQTRDLAVECAADAALHLLDTHFPYDTDFDPWAHVLVQNACRKFIRRSLKKSAVPEEKKVELQDDLAEPGELALEAQLLQKERTHEVESALAQLSEPRRAVLQMLYFDEREPEEVAQKLGKSVGAVYSLKFNALADLRKILDRIRDNLNE